MAWEAVNASRRGGRAGKRAARVAVRARARANRRYSAYKRSGSRGITQRRLIGQAYATAGRIARHATNLGANVTWSRTHGGSVG